MHCTRACVHPAGVSTTILLGTVTAGVNLGARKSALQIVAQLSADAHGWTDAAICFTPTSPQSGSAISHPLFCLYNM